MFGRMIEMRREKTALYSKRSHSKAKIVGYHVLLVVIVYGKTEERRRISFRSRTHQVL